MDHNTGGIKHHQESQLQSDTPTLLCDQIQGDFPYDLTPMSFFPTIF